MGLGYSSINTARSALSSFVCQIRGCSAGSLPSVRRLLKGIFNLRPSVPRYNCVWDVKLVLKYLETLSPLSDISLKDLTIKLTMLMVLLSAQRVQTLSLFKVDNMFIDEEKCLITISDCLKQTNAHRRPPLITFKKYENEKLCVIRTLKEYLTRTKDLRRNQNKLFLSYLKPHKPVHPNTISRWIKLVMERSGISTEIFKAHSTRAASTSAASLKAVNIETILKTAGWSNAKTFARFYDKPIGNDEFAEAVLASG